MNLSRMNNTEISLTNRILESTGKYLQTFPDIPYIKKWWACSQKLQDLLGIPYIHHLCKQISDSIIQALAKNVVNISPEKQKTIYEIERYKYIILGIAVAERKILYTLLRNIVWPKMMLDSICQKELVTNMPIPHWTAYRKQYMTCWTLSTANLVAIGDLAKQAWTKWMASYDMYDYVVVLWFACSRIIIHITYGLVMGHFLGNYRIWIDSILEKAKKIATELEYWTKSMMID